MVTVTAVAMAAVTVTVTVTMVTVTVTATVPLTLTLTAVAMTAMAAPELPSPIQASKRLWLLCCVHGLTPTRKTNKKTGNKERPKTLWTARPMSRSRVRPLR